MKRCLPLLAVVLLLLAGCTGVPSSSSPATVAALDTGAASNGPSIGPPLNADPDTIVSDFLTANTLEANRHTSARSFLTAAARNRWSDSIATVISDESGGTFNATTSTVTVFGRVVGKLTQDGTYQPSLTAQGTGGERQPFTFTLVKVKGQYRIDQLSNGLLLTQAQFRDAFQQHVIYFYDAEEKYLVPDLRWSSITDRDQLATWLLTEMVNGPRPDLQNAVSTDTLPAQTDASRITVTLGTPTRVEIPGSSQLAGGVRARLAAQVSQTLTETLSGRAMTITDGGRPVTIPQLGTTFTADQFGTATGPPSPEAAVYYLSGGRVQTEAGKPLSGPLGDGRTLLSSLAVHRDGSTLLVAGVQGSGDQARLVVGNQRVGVRAVPVHGLLTRPAFAPGTDEVWIGNGPKLFRVEISGTHGVVSPVTLPSAGGGRIIAIRLSPEGSRIAMVIAGATPGSATLYIGSIVRGSGQVRVDTLTAISPQGVAVLDVGWLDSLKLFAIGSVAGTTEARTFESGVDGSEWANSTIGNLQAAPDSVTVATAANVWVSENNLVWQQSGTQWVSPVSTGQTPGTMPIYLE